MNESKNGKLSMTAFGGPSVQDLGLMRQRDFTVALALI